MQTCHSIVYYNFALSFINMQTCHSIVHYNFDLDHYNNNNRCHEAELVKHYKSIP